MSEFVRIENWNYSQPLPDNCPMCHSYITPKIYGIYIKNEGMGKTGRVICFCPNSKCNDLYIVNFSQYEDRYRTVSVIFDGFSPITHVNEPFNKYVQQVSPNFIKIYNQAKEAEARKLDEICGLGYRKAFEFLLKDYLTMQNPEKENEIKSSYRLAEVIRNYVTDSKIKTVVDRITWLGNDHAHYIKRWESKDVEDLKKLINLLIYWISSELELKYYELEMPD